MLKSCYSTIFKKQSYSILCFQLLHQFPALECTSKINNKSLQSVSCFPRHSSGNSYFLESSQILDDPNEDLVKNILKENINRYNSIIECFMEIFSLKRKDAEALLSTNSYFKYIPKEIITYNYTTLRNCYISVNRIKENYSILIQDPPDLEKKIDYLQNNFKYVSMDCLIRFLHKDLRSIRTFVNTLKNLDKEGEVHVKLYKLADNMKVDYCTIFDILARNIDFVIYQPERFLEKIQLLLDFGVTCDELKNFDWPLYISYRDLKAKLIMLQKIRGNIKQREFQVIPKEEKAVIEHLARESGCSRKTIKEKLLLYNIPTEYLCRNYDTMINLLTSEGFNYRDIVDNIYIFNFKPQTLQKRLEKLQHISNKNIRLRSVDSYVKAMFEYYEESEKCSEN